MSTDEELIGRNILKLAPGGMRSILHGDQRATTRLGLRRYTLGSALLVDGHQELRIQIFLLEALELEKLTDKHARWEGCTTPFDLRAKIQRFYPAIRAHHLVTHVRFELIDQEPIEIHRRFGRRGRRHFGR